jgi:hypothetical protein
MLREKPGLIQVEEVRQALEGLAPFSPDEVPPFSCTLVDDDENLHRTLAWYARVGGAAYLAEMRACFDRLNSAPDRFAPEAFVLLEVCAPGGDEAWRQRVRASFAARPLAWIARERARAEALLGLPLDLLSIARDRLRGDEPLSGLPASPEVKPLLVERLVHVATQPGARYAGVSGCEALEIARRLEPAEIAAEPVRGALMARIVVEPEQHALEILDMLEWAGAPRAELMALALERLVRFWSESDFFSTNDAAAWVARHMTTRSAWEREGAEVAARLLDAAPFALDRIAHEAVRIARPNEQDRRGVCDAVLVTLARVFAERARAALESGDGVRAKALLLALMELDAPSFAMRFVRPLRKLAGADGEVASILSACDQQLRHDTGRVSSPDNVSRAVVALVRRTPPQPAPVEV